MTADEAIKTLNTTLAYHACSEEDYEAILVVLAELQKLRGERDKLIEASQRVEWLCAENAELRWKLERPGQAEESGVKR